MCAISIYFTLIINSELYKKHIFVITYIVFKLINYIYLHLVLSIILMTLIIILNVLLLNKHATDATLNYKIIQANIL